MATDTGECRRLQAGDPSPSAFNRSPWWWPLAALLILAAALRLGTLHEQSFWYDEAYVPVHTLHPSLTATLRSVVHRENTPPLWYVLIWGWWRLFGTGEVALRLPSALAGIATVGFAWGIGWELARRPPNSGDTRRRDTRRRDTRRRDTRLPYTRRRDTRRRDAENPSPWRDPRFRTAIATAALVAFNPLLVWYSQEARAYGLFVALSALTMWCWLRADAQPTPRRLAAFAASGAAALATHYFAVFLLAPMCLWLLRRVLPMFSSRTLTSGWRPEAITSAARGSAASGSAARGSAGGAAADRSAPLAALAAVAGIGAVGLALIPLALAQGGHGTQWIGAWALASRLEAIPRYYLTGYSSAPLGHGIELLVALEILVAIGYSLWRTLTPGESEAALLSLGVAACGVLIPLGMAVFGADYLAPRNVVAATIPLSAGIAAIAAARRTGRAGLALVGLIAVTFAALSIDVELSPRLQRGDWRGLAAAIGRTNRLRAITTVELGSAPLEYYLPPLRNLRRGAVVKVSEIDETGYAPLLPGAGEAPAPGFHLVQRRNINGMLLYRFKAPTPRTVSEDELRAHVIAEGRPEVLVAGEKE